MEVRFRKRFLPSVWARYATALVLLAAALAARLFLLPVEARLAFSTFLPAVVLAMYFCGVGPGALVAALGTLAGIYFFSPPYYAWAVDSASQWAALAFLSASALTGWVVHRLEATSSRLRDAMDHLSASERMLQTVVGDQTEMIFRFDRNGRFLFVNPAGRRTFGLDDDGMAEQTWHVLVDPQARAGVAEQLRRVTVEQAVVRTETRFAGPNGEWRWGEFVHHALFDARGQLTEVQTVGRDITEKHALQAQLAEAIASLQDLYDRAPCAYYSLDTSGQFVQLNAVCLAWLGCQADEVIGRLGPQDFFTAEGVAEFKRNFPLFLAEGHIGPLEFDLLGRDGSTRRVSLTATAVRDADGALCAAGLSCMTSPSWRACARKWRR
jgi:PAS domain S-box-containing protein